MARPPPTEACEEERSRGAGLLLLLLLLVEAKKVGMSSLSSREGKESKSAVSLLEALVLRIELEEMMEAEGESRSIKSPPTVVPAAAIEEDRPGFKDLVPPPAPPPPAPEEEDGPGCCKARDAWELLDVIVGFGTFFANPSLAAMDIAI